jgi:hypothetical protein
MLGMPRQEPKNLSIAPSLLLFSQKEGGKNLQVRVVFVTGNHERKECPKNIK